MHLVAADLTVTSEPFDLDVSVGEELNLPLLARYAHFHQDCITNSVKPVPETRCFQPVRDFK